MIVAFVWIKSYLKLASNWPEKPRKNRAKIKAVEIDSRHLFRQNVSDNVDGVRLGFVGWSGRQEDLQQGYHVLGEGGEHVLVEDLGRSLFDLSLRPGDRVLGQLLLTLDLDLAQ